MRDVILYSRERSPIALVFALAALLYSSGLQIRPSPFAYLSGLASMFLFLFLIRLSDDICDVPIDKITHPERLLSRGALSLPALNRFRVVAVLCLLLLQVRHYPVFIYTGVVVVLFSVFFCFKPKLPTLLHVALLNSSLVVFPIFAGLAARSSITTFEILMGLFFWAGGFAHDLSHSLLDTRNVDPQKLNPINKLNQAALAKLSLLAFLVSGGFGMLLYQRRLVGDGFFICLVIMILTMLGLEWKLIRQPSEKNAKPFYTFGFIYFLAPAACQMFAALFP